MFRRFRPPQAQEIQPGVFAARIYSMRGQGDASLTDPCLMGYTVGEVTDIALLAEQVWKLDEHAGLCDRLEQHAVALNITHEAFPGNEHGSSTVYVQAAKRNDWTWRAVATDRIILMRELIVMGERDKWVEIRVTSDGVFLVVDTRM